MTAEKAETANRVGTQVRVLIDRFHGGSIRAAAADLGIPVTTLFQVVKHQRQPRLDLVRKLAGFYQVSLDWLLAGTGPGVDYADDARRALDRTREGFRRLLETDNAPSPDQLRPEPSLSAGWLAWTYLLVERIGLQGETLAIWNSMPVVPVAFGLDSLFVQSAPHAADSIPALQDVPRGFDEAINASCRTWHTFISALLRIRGPDALRSEMERAKADAILGFSPMAAKLSRGDVTPSEFASRFGRAQAGLTTSEGRGSDVGAATPSRSPHAKPDSVRRGTGATRPTNTRPSRKRH